MQNCFLPNDLKRRGTLGYGRWWSNAFLLWSRFFCLLVARFLNNFLRSDYLISFEIGYLRGWWRITCIRTYSYRHSRSNERIDPRSYVSYRRKWFHPSLGKSYFPVFHKDHRYPYNVYKMSNGEDQQFRSVHGWWCFEFFYLIIILIMLLLTLFLFFWRGDPLFSFCSLLINIIKELCRLSDNFTAIWT